MTSCNGGEEEWFLVVVHAEDKINQDKEAAIETKPGMVLPHSSQRL